MKITKLGHACLLVEMPDRTTLFDPGVMSDVSVESLQFLDDIIITHEHGDHMNVDLLKSLVQKFPKVRIKASSNVTGILNVKGLQENVMQDANEGVEVFDAPHEPVEPLFPMPDNMGIHYLGLLTFPGDCLHFAESKAILALPVAAPWGSTVDAANVAIRLKPQHVIPIHDWHWSTDAKNSMYDLFEKVLQKEGITFYKMIDGEPVNIKL